MKLSRKLPAFLFLVATSLSSAQASPVPDDRGYGVARWNISQSAPNLNYYIDPSASSIATMIQASFADWAAIPTVYVSFTQVSAVDTANIIVRIGSVSSGAGAANTQLNGSGNITSCTIDISSDETPTKNTVQHETGHCLGLAHSVMPGAVMSYRDGGATPTLDDQYALTLLYPRDNANSYPMGCATISEDRDGGGPSGPTPLALLAPLAIMMAGFAAWRSAPSSR